MSEPQRAGADLPRPVRAYVDAVNDGDLDALVAAFAADAMIIDVWRHIRSTAAIRRWADREVIGGRLEVLEAHPHTGGVKLLVHWAPKEDPAGWKAWYDFDVAADRVTRADLQYA